MAKANSKAAPAATVKKFDAEQLLQWARFATAGGTRRDPRGEELADILTLMIELELTEQNAPRSIAGCGTLLRGVALLCSLAQASGEAASATVH